MHPLSFMIFISEMAFFEEKAFLLFMFAQKMT